MKKSGGHFGWLNWGIVAAVFPHLFCCVLPAVLAVVSIFTPVGGGAGFEIIPDAWMPWFLAGSGTFLFISFLILLRKCPCDDECPCAAHRVQETIFFVAIILYMIGLAEFFGGY